MAQKIQDVETKNTFKRDMVVISMLLVVAISFMFANFFSAGEFARAGKYYVALAGELRILSQSLVNDIRDASLGDEEAFYLLEKHKNEFDKKLNVLKNGDPVINLAPASDKIGTGDLLLVEQGWEPVRQNIKTVLMRGTVLSELAAITHALHSKMPGLQSAYDEVVGVLLEQGASAEQLYVATRQTWLSEHIVYNIERILKADSNAHKASIDLSHDAEQFEKVINAMLSGNIGLGISKVKHPQAIKKLRKIRSVYKDIHRNIIKLVAISNDIKKVQYAVHQVHDDSDALSDRTSLLFKTFTSASEGHSFSTFSEYILGGVSVLLLVLLVYRAYVDTRIHLDISAKKNKENQDAISQLVKELIHLADGDLTVKATVSNSFTGAIAESTNYAIDALRKLVSTINAAVVKVSSSAQQAKTFSEELARASSHQAREVSGATASINAIARAIEHVSTNASESHEVSEQSLKIASEGVQVVQNSIGGMDRIREQIQETSKRIKRLGESSQEIGDTVSLIADIADQTNILALNATIQAAMAGESGRGFGVVADEVQRLAERSGHATKQIAALVKAIQSDINEATISMEQSTTEVVQGAKLAQDAGVALEKIENVSSHLAELIQNIYNSAESQVESSMKMSKTMSLIQDIANNNSKGTKQTVKTIDNLALLAEELNTSISGFKLPKTQA